MFHYGSIREKLMIKRRAFLQAIAVSSASPFILQACNPPPENPLPVQLDTTLPIDLDDDTPAATRLVFDVSVASGDPSPTGVVIWTHLNPETLQAGVDLGFEVASDAQFTDIVLQGFVAASDITADRDHTVSIDLQGQLAPYSTYYYRFVYNAVSSRTGRCKTTPADDQAIEELKLAILSCQDYTNGYYGALNYLAADDSIDFVIHLGDFIYETVGDPTFQTNPFSDRILELPSGSFAAMDVDDYRYLYRSYRSDLNLQLAMEHFTWIITSDDHETANDCYWDYERDTLGAPDHPYSVEAEYENDAELLRQLKRDSLQAWLEWVPARVSIDANAAHPHDYASIYRNIKFGSFAEIFMLDTRSYRTPHPCGEGTVGSRYATSSKACDAIFGDEQSILGEAQRNWLFSGLNNSSRQWKLLGNQTFMGRLAITDDMSEGFYINVDSWDGYSYERDLLSRNIVDNNVENLVVITGDLHSYIAAQLKDNYNFDLFTGPLGTDIGVEFMTPALTSSPFLEIVVTALNLPQDQGESLSDALEKAILPFNPHIRMFNSKQHGYSTLTLRADHCDWEAFSIDKNSNDADNARWKIAHFRKIVGNAELQLINE